MTDSDSDKFLKGIIATMGIVVAIMTIWSFYTQSNRFTAGDGLRHEKRFEKIEEVNLRIEEKYDRIAVQLSRIEGSLNYVRFFARKGKRSEDESPIPGVKFD